MADGKESMRGSYYMIEPTVVASIGDTSSLLMLTKRGQELVTKRCLMLTKERQSSWSFSRAACCCVLMLTIGCAESLQTGR